MILDFISYRTSSSSTAGREARIQTGALPAVGWSVLLGFFLFAFGAWTGANGSVLSAAQLDLGIRHCVEESAGLYL